jgi:uncharacterized membrane protein
MTFQKNLASAGTGRLQSIDMLRGMVMIIMTLDHVRDFFHYNVSIDEDPLDFKTTTPLLFLTRWVTHFCAPIFVFLSGTSVFLFGSKGKTKSQVAFFLLTRGLWLMLAEIFIILPLWNFNFSMLFLQVIWAIGLSMVVLSILQFLPFGLLVILGLLIVFGHNLLDQISVNNPLWKSLLWSIIHKRNEYRITNDFMVVVSYPFLPWLGVMILGYAMGKFYLPNISPKSRQKMLKRIGIAVIILFILIRWINCYGDMHPWSRQQSGLYSFFDFIKTSKYPPSLLYILMTIGPGLIFLAFAENISGRVKDKITLFGKVPFFYYVLHVFLIHSLSWLAFFASGHGWKDLDFDHFRDASLPPGCGYSLWIVYVVWAMVIIILYFPCKWYNRYKSTHRDWWLSYI